MEAVIKEKEETTIKEEKRERESENGGVAFITLWRMGGYAGLNSYRCNYYHYQPSTQVNLTNLKWQRLKIASAEQNFGKRITKTQSK